LRRPLRPQWPSSPSPLKHQKNKYQNQAHLHVLGGRLRGLNGVLLPLLLQLEDELGLLLGLQLVALDLLLQVALGVVVDLDEVQLLLGGVLGL